MYIGTTKMPIETNICDVESGNLQEHVRKTKDLMIISKSRIFKKYLPRWIIGLIATIWCFLSNSEALKMLHPFYSLT